MGMITQRPVGSRGWDCIHWVSRCATSSEHCFHIIYAHVKDFRDDIIAAMRL